MKFLITLLLSMTAAGTLPFLVYLIVSAVMPQHLSAAIRYRCMKFFLILYLVPFPMIRYFIVRNFTEPAALPAKTGQNTLVELQDCIVQFNGGFVISRSAPVYIVLAALWMVVLCFMLIYNLSGFIRFKKEIKQYTEPDLVHQELFRKLKTEYHIGNRTGLYQYHSLTSPFTLGTLHPTVLLTDAVDENDVELILRHELRHVKSHDFFLRMLALMAILIHWFNPFVYVFFNELKEVQELACDEWLLSSFSTDRKRQYGYLLINATVTGLDTPVYTLHFSRNNRIFLKKRISRIGQKSYHHPVHTHLLLAVLLILAILPVYFYSPKTVDFRSDPSITASDLKDSSWILYTSSDQYESPNEALFQYTDMFFVSEDGSVTADLSTPEHAQPENDEMSQAYIDQQMANASHGIVKPVPQN